MVLFAMICQYWLQIASMYLLPFPTMCCYLQLFAAFPIFSCFLQLFVLLLLGAICYYLPLFSAAAAAAADNENDGGD